MPAKHDGATKRQVDAELKRLSSTMNVSFDVFNKEYEAYIDAPDGYVFDSHALHAVVITGAANKKELWEYCLCELKGTNVRKCDTPDCDYCCDN